MSPLCGGVGGLGGGGAAWRAPTGHLYNGASRGVAPLSSINPTVYTHVESASMVHQTPSYSDEYQFECSDCGKRYKHQKNLQRHRKYECGKEPQFQCSYCPHRAKQKGHLKTHMEIIHNPTPQIFNCDVCPFKTNSCFLPSETPRVFCCQNCGKCYRRLSGLENHSRLGCGKDLQFECSYCPYKTKLKQNLARHLNETHNPNFLYHCEGLSWADCHRPQYRHRWRECGKEARFKCSYCPHKSKQKGNLLRHINDVHNPRPLMHCCHLCPYKTKQKSNLNYAGSGTHFRCPGCGKTYLSVNSLRRHVKLECGKEPMYQCSHCPLRTKHRSNLARHVNDKHNPNPKLFACDLCPYSAKQKSAVVTHRIFRHKLAK
ncbi:hypothetical protein AAG570_013976 [Ranatra chinensis]|uniref:C2H2-type domain-containing protein n=1 Tax=Ranatra chinensis TaxID=642074 RepID=A0ABD0YDR3_9HEMI